MDLSRFQFNQPSCPAMRPINPTHMHSICQIIPKHCQRLFVGPFAISRCTDARSEWQKCCVGYGGLVYDGSRMLYFWQIYNVSDFKVEFEDVLDFDQIVSVKMSGMMLMLIDRENRAVLIELTSEERLLSLFFTIDKIRGSRKMFQLRNKLENNKKADFYKATLQRKKPDPSPQLPPKRPRDIELAPFKAELEVPGCPLTLPDIRRMKPT